MIKISKKEEKWLKVLKVIDFGGQTYDFLEGVNFGRIWQILGILINFGGFGENFDGQKSWKTQILGFC